MYENPIPLDRAMHVASLWAAGKMIGEDIEAVCLTLYTALAQPRRVRWEDLALIAENSPGVLRDVGLLRKRLFEQGPMTLEELLQWQARPRHTTKLGALPVTETSIDLLDRALTAATERIAESERRAEHAEAQWREAAAGLHALDPNRLSSLAIQLRSLADAIEGNDE